MFVGGLQIFAFVKALRDRLSQSGSGIFHSKEIYLTGNGRKVNIKLEINVIILAH